MTGPHGRACAYCSGPEEGLSWGEDSRGKRREGSPPLIGGHRPDFGLKIGEKGPKNGCFVYFIVTRYKLQSIYLKRFALFSASISMRSAGEGGGGSSSGAGLEGGARRVRGCFN